MLNAKKTLTKILDALKADYIVEQGTDGGWKYRKWYSGTAECWRIAELGVTSWSSWGSWFYTAQNTNIVFPTGLFLDAPVAEVTRTGGIDSIPVITSVNATQINTVYAVRPNASGTGSIWIAVHAIGKWK